ncbi:MAG: GTP 3',8-cyclase MoaA [Lentimicrobiaceae bacterium]|nr:GTP 3',8-cyclase MoaA [Lentimicrobiaceae bacterium]MCB9024396.1 GTP 3',8-cyclase MoaA [Lentimicrobiaceae bacterium]MCO5265656.1 GTP 3',8-cyclase MoaA [Lentimicrobium sp.]HPG32797.1 GTP 3',8-cyclase MoaA [Lentimicrobium sp.]
MYDSFDRKINYLRISVTDRCNLRCIYCMPEEGIKMLQHNEVLSFEEIDEITRIAVSMGVNKVRITGGEPLVRKGIVSLIEMLGKIEGITDLSMTTNGILLDKYAALLKKAGLHRINVSLDSLNPEKFRKLTRGGDLSHVLSGIEAAKKAGLTPIKINCVVQKSSEEPDAVRVADYCHRNGLQVRFIHQMSLTEGHFSVVEGGSGGDCSTCSRLRLTANGKLMPCLFSDLEFDVREMGIQRAIQAALDNKPACGSMNLSGEFYNIGG